MNETEQPWVTWLIPILNGMPFLPSGLQTIVDQTYRNYTVLVWDNGSTDGTLEELRRWIPERIPGRIVADRPLPLGASLARLVEEAETEFCARFDADDLNRPERLERQARFLLEHPSVGVVGSQIHTIDEHGNPLPEYNHESSDAEIRWLARYGCRLCHPSVMFRRSVILAAGNYHDVPSEDTDLWLRTADVTEMANLPERLVCYRRRTGSVTGSIRDWLPVLRRIAESSATRLFPGIDDSERALDLWDATVPSRLTWIAENRHPAKPSHLRDLKRSAVLLARRVGKPDDYFTGAEIFREQYYLLKRRVLKRFGLSPLLWLRDRAASARV
ncbi:MAG: glycosyltransferase [Acidobacteriaceae bacterium]|nr:glycosyltransferase [Acidobacteriaceae bacterium]